MPDDGQIEAGQDAGDLDVGAPDVGGDVDAGGGAQDVAPEAAHDAPAGDEWRPPTREEYAALQQKAELGSRYAPFQQQIDALIQRGFTPAEAKQAVNEQKKADDGDDEFTNPEKYGAMWKQFGSNPAAFRKLLHREALHAGQEKFLQLDALQKRIDALEGRSQEVYSAAVLANRRFSESPEFKKYGAEYLKVLGTGNVRDPDLAWEIAQARIDKAAAARSAKAPASSGEPAAPAAATPRKPAQSAPREDRSAPKPGASRSAVPASGSMSTSNVTGSRGRAAVLAAARKHGISLPK